MSLRKELTDRFAIQTDDGHTIPVLEYTTRTIVHTMDGKPDSVEGLKELITADGRPVNQVNEREYEIVETQQIDVRADIKIE